MAGTAAAGTVVAGAGVVDGAPDGARAGGPLGDLDGDPLGDLDGDGADHVSSRRQDFTDADVSSGVLSVDPGGRAGFSSTGAGDKEVSRLTRLMSAVARRHPVS